MIFLRYFFNGKVLHFVQAQIYFFLRFDFWFLFNLSSFPSLKGRQTPLSNSKSVKVTKSKRDRFLVSKKKINFQIPQRNKNLPFDQVFSKSVKFSKKISIIKCSCNSMALRSYIFLFAARKLNFSNKQVRIYFFLFSCVRWLFFQLYAGYVLINECTCCFFKCKRTKLYHLL